MSLKCSACGKIVETLPLDCGYSISFNEETQTWECYMEDCGFIAFTEFLCEDCCKKQGKCSSC
ncbi:MAG: hypothetical protein ACFFBH_00010 [Promethearchaeota archaeon]